ncbi:pyrimidine-specific ribonucleoside hydrolase RihB [Abditibacteriota bacterium]|nr:pyrimidine-specific ribonucleoside hydrolase RihB [Abditibacteriota bacterium]
MADKISIILDTDIGDDVDDALALTVALRSPEIEVVGVTTVFRDAPRRALLAREVLRLLGRTDIPVYAGCSQPLLPDWENFPGGQKLGRQFEALDATLKWEEPRHAVDYLIQTAREFAKRGETLTFVPIGALTNIALAFHLAPDIVSAVKVRLMGGLWGRGDKEWNIWCDPEAAAMVLGSGAHLTFVSIDVTEQVVLSDEETQRFSNSTHPAARFLSDLIKLWGHKVTLHDPLTVLTLFSDLVTFEPMRLQVPLCGEKRALTERIEGVPIALVSTHVKVEDAKEVFLERILG